MLINNKPNLTIIAGANGVGKTTFAKPYVQELGYQFLNADEIAKELEGQGEAHPMLKAGRLFFARLNESLTKKENILLETTLSGSYINKVAARSKKIGYALTVVYIFVDSEAVCIDRVKSRVLKGGHDVPVEDITRRFQRSLTNFWTNFTELADDWVLLYNGDEGYEQVAVGVSQQYSVEHQSLFSFFQILTNQ